MIKKTWKEFQQSMLLWWVNRSLHLFGWAIVFEEEDDGSISKVYPARVSYRGFCEGAESEGFKGLTEYLAMTMPGLKEDVSFGGDHGETPLRVAVEDGELVIRIGIKRLDGHADHPDLPELPIIDHEAWAESVAYELGRDRGDGATPISLCLDLAMRTAIDGGSTGIDYRRAVHREDGVV